MKTLSFLSPCAILAMSLIAHADSATHTVQEGESIQSAVERAQPGDRIEVMPGEYHHPVTIEKDGITLVGLKADGERAILDGEGKQIDAIRITGNDVTITGFSLRHFVDSAITAHNAKGIVIRDSIVDDAGRHGIAARACSNIRIEGCVVGDINGEAVLISGCQDAIVRDNEMFHGHTGIQIENSINTRVENNSSHHNATGLIVSCLPNQAIKISEHCKVINNRFIGNVAKNAAADAGFPALGVGLLIIAADHIEVVENTIRENGAYGIAVMSITTAKLPGVNTAQLDIDPNADYLYVHQNTYRDNGTNTPEALKKDRQTNTGADLFWDETGKSNQWQEPNTLTQVPRDLIKKQAGAHTNVIEFH